MGFLLTKVGHLQGGQLGHCLRERLHLDPAHIALVEVQLLQLDVFVQILRQEGEEDIGIKVDDVTLTGFQHGLGEHSGLHQGEVGPVHLQHLKAALLDRQHIGGNRHDVVQPEVEVGDPGQPGHAEHLAKEVEGGVGDGDDLVLPQAGVGGHPVPLGGDQGAVVQPLVREQAGGEFRVDSGSL